MAARSWFVYDRTMPTLAAVGALIGDPSRAEVLTTLLAGRALSAAELAVVAGVGKSTISVHLEKLRRGGLLAVERQGRHKYFRLQDRNVARALESLLGVAGGAAAALPRTGPADPALRRARVCYDHLAGALGVFVFERLQAGGALAVTEGEADVALTARGERTLAALGVDVPALRAGRRAFGRTCLDWSERRYHLAGALGAALLERVVALRWARRAPRSRALLFSPSAEARLRDALG